MSDTPDPDKAEIARLSALTPVQYDREREASAKKLGCRPGTLDVAVEGQRKKPAPEPKPSRAQKRYGSPPTGKRSKSDPTLAQLAASKPKPQPQKGA